MYGSLADKIEAKRRAKAERQRRLQRIHAKACEDFTGSPCLLHAVVTVTEYDDGRPAKARLSRG